MAQTEAAGAVPLTARQAPAWVDAVAAAVAAVLTVVVLLTADLRAIDVELREAPAWIVALAAVGALGVGLRRRAPLAGLLLTAAVATLVSLGGYYTALLPYLILFCLYSVAAHATRRQGIAGIGLLTACFAGLVAFDVPDLTIGDVATNGALGVAAVALGDAMRSRRAHQSDLLTTARAEAAVSLAESQRAVAESQRAVAESQRAVAESQRAVADERLRIARELHDVVAHSMSLIAVQAGVGAHLLHRDPTAAERALEVIADTSREALAQARSVIGLLRTGDDAQPSLPGLTALGPLVQGVRDAGLPVELTVHGVLADVPAAVDLAAYRIVQEGLTNAVRHAPGRPVSVRLDRTPEELQIDILDGAGPTATGSARVDVPAGPRTALSAGSPSGGYGLAGLRERAATVGGELTAGPTPEGGFRLSARLPLVRVRAQAASEPARGGA